MKTLIAGPWSGEFGWELFAWQAYIRSLSKYFEKTTIICRENSQYLYSDFATSYVICEPNVGLADSFFMHGYDQNKEIKRILKETPCNLSEKTTIFLPRRIGWPPNTHYHEEFVFGDYTIKPEYVIFNGNSHTDKYDYIFHARNRQLRKEDNWSVDNWNLLSEKLGGKIACIGTKKESMHINGTTDLRDMNLKDLCGIIHSAKCVFGPSSGPMHLTSLCNTPHVVWSIPQNKIRYETNWNPHKTPVLFLDKFNWHPKAEYIYESYFKWSNQ